VVLGNPPWDIITIKKKEWFAAFNFEILTAKSKQQRDRVERGVLSDAHNAVAFRDYVNEFEGQKRINDLLYTRQKVTIEGDLAGRFLDTFRVFMERNAQLLDTTGMTGTVVPSAFHANEPDQCRRGLGGNSGRDGAAPASVLWVRGPGSAAAMGMARGVLDAGPGENGRLGLLEPRPQWQEVGTARRTVVRAYRVEMRAAGRRSHP